MSVQQDFCLFVFDDFSKDAINVVTDNKYDLQLDLTLFVPCSTVVWGHCYQWTSVCAFTSAMACSVVLAKWTIGCPQLMPRSHIKPRPSVKELPGVPASASTESGMPKKSHTQHDKAAALPVELGLRNFPETTVSPYLETRQSVCLHYCLTFPGLVDRPSFVEFGLVLWTN